MSDQYNGKILLVLLVLLFRFRPAGVTVYEASPERDSLGSLPAIGWLLVGLRLQIKTTRASGVSSSPTHRKSLLPRLLAAGCRCGFGGFRGNTLTLLLAEGAGPRQAAFTAKGDRRRVFFGNHRADITTLAVRVKNCLHFLLDSYSTLAVW